MANKRQTAEIQVTQVGPDLQFATTEVAKPPQGGFPAPGPLLRRSSNMETPSVTRTYAVRAPVRPATIPPLPEAVPDSPAPLRAPDKRLRQLTTVSYSEVKQPLNNPLSRGSSVPNQILATAWTSRSAQSRNTSPVSVNRPC